MKNLDVDVKAITREDIFKQMNQAINEGDQEKYTESFNLLVDDIQKKVIEEANLQDLESDRIVLASRGVRQLTSQEKNYYQKVISAMKSSNPKQELADVNVVMPITTINAVFEDLITNHPLLEAINFQNTSGLVEYLVNTNETQLASWDVLCSDIVKELNSGFKKIKLDLNKLSAFLPICKAMLDLGPEWLDRYVREVLYEALALGLEKGIITGNGLNMPIGMIKDITSPLDQTNGHADKAPIKITSLDPVTYGNLLSKLSVTPKGNVRVITEVALIVNPIDYVKKIMPISTVRASDGGYAKDVFPFPTKIIQSTQVPEGQVVVGLPSRYFMGIGTEKSGKIEYSDDYRFLEDERVYLIKLYGNGQPVDNTAFIVCDITELKPEILKVEVIGTPGE